ncbi:hypothetical protein [Ruminococcus sp.]|uniref:hypothetical protein n=1 Tax=Ruminococcus sp. TaxID=41978 RepID=UPI00402A03C0
MLSQEFKATVSDKNLLRTRIMLKDSFVVDPTFVQLDEMLSYARVYLPGLFVPFDGECLENDEAKWNDNVMNEELVQLVTNFSETRINHLKKVVSKVLKPEIEKIRRKKIEQSARPPISSQFTPPPVSRESSPLTKQANRRKALKVLQNEGGKIQNIMTEVTSRHTWKPTNVDDMERAAREILRAAKDYKNNR